MLHNELHARRSENDGLRSVVLGLLCLIVIVSIETFNSTIMGISEEEMVQQTGDVRAQVIAMALWSVVVGLSFAPGVSRFCASTRGLVWPTVLLTWIVISPVWSNDPASDAPKALVFLASSLAAWRTAAVVTTEEMFSCLFYGLLALLVTSLIMVLFMPSVALDHGWLHEGQWKGAFGTKQGLGAVSAVFLLVALLRISRRRSLFGFAACGIALACLLGSGSRGAGAMAAVAAVCLVVRRRRPKLAPLLAAVLVVSLVLGILEIIYFAITGEASILAFGYDINLTERTFIWQYAVGHWVDWPYLGFGLNGFWTDPYVSSGFRRLHGWVLDNYHSGYLAIVVETGAVGLALFCVVVGLLTFKLTFLFAHVNSDRLSLEMTVGFLVMFFTINLTETFFLRSTNFMSVLFTFLLTKILAYSPHYAVGSVAAGYRSASPGREHGFRASVAKGGGTAAAQGSGTALAVIPRAGEQR